VLLTLYLDCAWSRAPSGQQFYGKTIAQTALSHKSLSWQFPKPQSECWHGHRHSRGPAQPGEPVGEVVHLPAWATSVTKLYTIRIAWRRSRLSRPLIAKQNRSTGSVYFWRAALRAAGTAVPAYAFARPDKQRPLRLQHGVVVFPVGYSILPALLRNHAFSRSRATLEH
jgi:hypothetical protein